MNKTERLIGVGLLTVPLLAIFIAATPAGKRAPDKAQIQWVGRPVIQDSEGSMSGVDGYQLGLRPDGVVVWRKTPEKKGK